MKKLSILIILTGESLEGGGGAERRFVSAFNVLSIERKLNVRLLVNRSLLSSMQKIGLLNDCTNVYVIEERRIFNKMCYNLSVIRYIIFNRPHILHLPLIQKRLVPVYLFLFFLKRFLGVKVVGTIASYLYAYRLHSKISDRLLYSVFLSSADMLDSLYSKTQLKRLFAVTPCSFVDYSRFIPLSKENVVVFLGRLISQKNPILFLEAIEILLTQTNKDFSTWRFVISGDGPLKKQILDFVAEKKLDLYVSVCRGNPASLLGKSKIFVSLQEHENYPSQSLLEAIACKNIIIATDVGDTRRILGGSHSAILIPSEKLALAEALAQAIDSEESLFAETEKLRDKVMKEHTLERFTQYLKELWLDAAT